MGGVAILHPQDVLKQQPFVKQPLISSPSSSYMKHQQPRTNTASNNRTNNRRKKSPSASPVPNKTMVNKISPPVMGQVKILKRGQDLALDQPTTFDTRSDRVSDVVKVVETGEVDRIGSDLEVTGRWGPEPEILSKQINVLSGFYAGSAVVASPPPSSLPLPGFFSRNDVIVNNKHATNDLLRMLRLNLA